MKQSSFSDRAYEHKKKTTRKERFLGEMDAAVHDSVVMDECLHGEEAVIYGDKAYASEGRRQAAVARDIDWRVNRKARRGKRLNCADRSFNRKSNRTRSRVEHAFGVIKHLWGYR